MRKLSIVEWIALVLVIVGALNWGLIGLFGFNLVAALFGEMTAFSKLVYILVGVAAVVMLYTAYKAGSSPHGTTRTA
jgi:uncharacterized membrane protein YuzA (DUF378 family)